MRGLQRLEFGFVENLFDFHRQNICGDLIANLQQLCAVYSAIDSCCADDAFIVFRRVSDPTFALCFQ